MNTTSLFMFMLAKQQTEQPQGINLFKVKVLYIPALKRGIAPCRKEKLATAAGGYRLCSSEHHLLYFFVCPESPDEEIIGFLSLIFSLRINSEEEKYTFVFFDTK